MIAAVTWGVGSVLALSAALALVRVVRGPTVLDRVVALELVMACLLGALALHEAFYGDGSLVTPMLVLALLAFVGSVAVARFVAADSDDEHDEAPEFDVAGPDVPAGQEPDR